MITRRGLIQASALSAIVPAAQAAEAEAPIIRLHLNENPYGPSDRAKDAIRAAINDGWAYDNEDVVVLRRMIAAKEGLKPENVFICEGSTELLRLAGAIFTGGGKELVAGLPTFLAMPQYAARSGGKVRFVNVDSAMRLDLAAMQAKVTADTGAVYVCNPNNPTGTLVAADALNAFIAAVEPRALVVVDEAYIDLVDEPDKTTVIAQVRQGRNVLISRTFSKIHGIAGLRVGYGLGRPDVIRALEERRISVPNRLGLKAAIASHQDAEFLAFSRMMVRACVAYTEAAFEKMKVKYIPSSGNFVLFDTRQTSVNFAEYMRGRRILVNPVLEPTDTWCRVSMGRMEQMEAFVEAARGFFKS